MAPARDGPRSLGRMDALSLDALVTLENDGWKSLLTSRGGTFYGELMTPDAVMILVNGMILDRDTIAGSLNEAPAWDTYAIADPRLIALGTDAATLVYHSSSERAGEDAFEATMSSTYRLVDGKARLAVYQQTTITH